MYHSKYIKHFYNLIVLKSHVIAREQWLQLLYIYSTVILNGYSGERWYLVNGLV